MPRQRPTARLAFKTCWRAPGYRDLTFVLVDEAGKEYELNLPPKDVQRVIFECADAAKQISDHPPIDWPEYPSQILWPQIVPWMAGPSTALKGGPTALDPNRPYCKPDQSCCDFVCGN